MKYPSNDVLNHIIILNGIWPEITWLMLQMMHAIGDEKEDHIHVGHHNKMLVLALKNTVSSVKHLNPKTS